MAITMVIPLNKTLLSYYPNRTFVNKEYVYSVIACKQEYLAKSLEVHTRDVIKNLLKLAVSTKGNLLEDLQYLRKRL